MFGRIGFRGYTKSDIVEQGNGAITISPSNMIENGEMNFNCVSYISWFKYDESPEIQIAVNDILIVKTGSSYGKTCVITSLPEKATINPQIAVLKYNFINPEILCYILSSPLCKEQFEKYVIGTSIPTFSQEKLSSTLIPLPPIHEQKRMACVIRDIFSRINTFCLHKEQLNTLENRLHNSLRNSILQEAIRGRLVPQIESEGTAEELLEEIRAEKQRLFKEDKLKKSAIANKSRIFRGDDNKYREKKDGMISLLEDEIPFEIPATWTWVRLDDICTYIQRGKSPKYSLTKKIPVVAQKCNQWSGFQIDKAQFIEPASIDSYGEERKLVDGDLMWNSTGLGTLGRMAIYWERLNPYGIAVADSHVTVIRPIQNKILSEYLFAYLSSYTVQSVIEDKSDGSTKQKELSTSTVKNYLVPLPPYEEQKRIVAKIHKVLASIMSR